MMVLGSKIVLQHMQPQQKSLKLKSSLHVSIFTVFIFVYFCTVNNTPLMIITRDRFL